MAIFLVGLDETTFTQRFLQYTTFGPWRLVSLSAYGDPEDTRYAAIWHHHPAHPPQDFRLRMKFSELGNVIAERYAAGMLPTVVTATSGPPVSYEVLGTAVHWGMVFEQNVAALPLSALMFESTLTYEELYSRQRQEPGVMTQTPFGPSVDTSPDRDVVCFDGFGLENGETRYSALLYPKANPVVGTGLNRVAVPEGAALDAWEADVRTKTLRRGWSRPEQAVPSPSASLGTRAVVTQWRDDVFAAYPKDMGDGTFTGGAVVVGPMPLDQMQAAHDQVWAEGWIPHRVGITGVGAEARACVVYTRALQVLPRKFVVVDARDADPPTQVGASQLVELPRQPFFDAFAYRLSCRGNDAAELRGMIDLEVLGTPPSVEASNDTSGRASSRVASQRASRRRPGSFGAGDVQPYSSQGAPGWTPYQEPLVLGFQRYAKLDAWVRARLELWGARAAQLAIARGGRLVVNRAYTLAEAGYPVTLPTHLMCVGSIAKALTGMAAAHHFFPFGEISGQETPLDVALGIQSTANASLLQKLAATPLSWLLRHASGWPGDFSDAAVALAARGAPPPPIPGDALAFVRSTPDDFYAPMNSFGGYPEVYSGATLRALSEALGRRFGPANAVSDEAKYVEEMQKWWDLPAPQARVRATTPELAILDGFTPVHSRVIEVAEVPRLIGGTSLEPISYSGSVDFAAAAGGWSMSAATLVRILSGMDPSSNVPGLLGVACVQRMLDDAATGKWSSLFSSHEPPGSGKVGLFHNGKSHGVWSVAGLYFQAGSTPPAPGQPTTCIAYLENMETAGESPQKKHAADLIGLAEEIEAELGWEAGDLFDAV